MAPPKRKLPAPTRPGASTRNGAVAPPGGVLRTERLARVDVRSTPDWRFVSELAAWIGVAAISLAIRLLNVDGNPLQPAESVLALDSWRIVHQHGVVIEPAPLFIYLNALLFLVLGATDAVARSVSVWSGWLVAMSPFLLRRQIGRIGALAAATILAVSPSLVFASRSVDPSMLAVGLGLTSVLAISRSLGPRQESGLYLGAVAGVLLLMAGPPGDALALIALTFAALVVYRIWRQSRGTLAEAPVLGFEFGFGWLPVPRSLVLRDLLPTAKMLKSLTLVVVLTYGLIATGFGTHLEGLGNSLAGPLAAQVMSFGDLGSHPFWLYPALLIGYEPFALVFGIVGAVIGFRKRRLLDVFWAWWAALGFLILFLSNGQDPIWIVLVVVPLGFLGGRAIDEVVMVLSGREERREFLVFAAGVLPLIATSLIALGNVTLPQPNVPDWVGAIPPMAIVAFIIAFAFWYSWRSAYRSLAGVGIIALFGFSVHAAMLLNPGGQLNPAEYFTGTVTSSDVRTLASDSITILDELEIAQQLEGRNVNSVVDVAPTFAQPIVWYLTRPSDVRASASININVVQAGNDSPGIAVVAANDKAPKGPYVGELFEYSLSAPLPRPSFFDWWRWWIYHQTADPQSTFVKVYVKTQLARP